MSIQDRETPLDAWAAVAAPRATNDETLLPGDVVDGRYLVERELGRGGMGVVYLGRDIDLERPVALKMMSRGYASSPEQASAFRREAAAIASIRSEHIVQVYAFGLHKGAPFFVMEHVRGPSLHDLIAEHAAHEARVPLHRAVTIMLQIASGLGAVHRAGAIHRDVKPENVVVEEVSGRPVLIDFGLANRTGDLVEGRSAIGTPDYMAPEQCNPVLGRPTPETDIYALGCTTYELFTGEPPFTDCRTTEALIDAHLNRAPPLVSARRPDLASLDGVVARAMAKAPGDRFDSAEAFSSALRAATPTDSRPVIEPLVAPLSMPGTRPARVLVIDDDPIFCRLSGRAAELAFYDMPVRVETADSGDEALAKAALAMPDLVLLDCNMPGLSGVETLSRLRASPSGHHPRVVVVSASVGAVERWQFSVLGVRDFLDKSGGLPLLVDFVTRVAREVTPKPTRPG